MHYVNPTLELNKTKFKRQTVLLCNILNISDLYTDVVLQRLW